MPAAAWMRPVSASHLAGADLFPPSCLMGMTAFWMGAVALLGSLLQPGPALAEESPRPLMQAFFGSLQLDDQVARWDDITGEPVTVEFPSSLPSGGIEAEYRYGGSTAIDLGINSGGSIGWKNSDTRISGGFTASTGGFVRFDFDNSLLIGELHLGGFLRAHLGDRISLYAAVGPMVMYGQHEIEDEEIAAPDDEEAAPDSDSDSAFGFGYYGRAGIDVQYSPGQHLGLGVRYLSAELDFDKTVGGIDIEGPQFVITYSARL